MRHRRKGRKLGRSPSHQRALLRNLAASLILSERDEDHPVYVHDDPQRKNLPPKVKGRITTTVAKAKEVRPLIEKCITIARRSLVAQERADELETDAERNSDEWRQWRKGEGWQQWSAAVAPVLAARRRCLRLLGHRGAVELLFDEIAPRFTDRQGGYTRILHLATPRLGDAGPQAILEFVGKDDRRAEAEEAPALEQVESDDVPASEEQPATQPAAATAEGAEAPEEQKEDEKA